MVDGDRVEKCFQMCTFTWGSMSCIYFLLLCLAMPLRPGVYIELFFSASAEKGRRVKVVGLNMCWENGC